MKLIDRELCTDYKNDSNNFLVKKKTYEYQYAPLYAERLQTMRGLIIQTVTKKWPDIKVKNLVELEKNERSIIIGTIYKEMPNKPNILKEMADDENNMISIQPVNTRDKYVDLEKDQLILEDEVQRILLVDPEDETNKNIVKSNRFCTGLVIAFIGYENEQSKFVVEDYCFKDTPYPSKPFSLNQDKYLCFISGIELGDMNMNQNMFKLQLFIDFLSGDFLELESSTTEQTKSKTVIFLILIFLNFNNKKLHLKEIEYDRKMRSMLANTSRLVIVGNSLASSTQSKDMHKQAKYLTKNFVAGSVGAIKQLDDFLLQLTSKLDVDLMPGEFDPSNMMLPQQPLHYAMFAKSHSKLHSVTNPYRFEMNDVCFLGTSGQFIDDIRRVTSLDDPIDLMKVL